eukprot:TRINITY_DN8514_c0_g4_i1.p1 TRINITY_DN8514_c0_g4~~TRINITY_DN8514_c0_g4_i1.p1  ORF type:complete len:403 (-),score=36.39 TRINITY_DN8514_c0_g4_i1:854-1939(-)
MRTKSLPLLGKIQSQTCDLLNEMPGVKECPNASPPVKHLENIILRYSIMQDLTSDHLNKVNKSIAQIKESCFDGDYLESLEPYKFSAFRSLAIDFIRKNNSEYAKMLEDNTFGSINGQFSFFMQTFQRHPRITRLDEHGKTHLWTYTLDMQKDFAADKLRTFLMDNTYNLDDYAVIFLVPADWSGVVKFYQMYPRGEAMVFDPFPELFSEIINYCLITPQLPPEMVVAAWHPELRRREKICQRTVARWKREGRKILIYTHPLAIADPEVVNHRKTLDKLIATAQGVKPTHYYILPIDLLAQQVIFKKNRGNQKWRVRQEQNIRMHFIMQSVVGTGVSEYLHVMEIMSYSWESWWNTRRRMK